MEKEMWDTQESKPQTPLTLITKAILMLKVNKFSFALYFLLIIPNLTLGQEDFFDKSKWSQDKYGISGQRAGMELPIILTEEYLINEKNGAFDSLISLIGYPDKLCFGSEEIYLFWYLEGYLHKTYFDSDSVMGKECGEDFQVPNSFMVFTFSCDGSYISSALINEGG